MFRNLSTTGLWTYVRSVIEIILLMPVLLFVSVFILRGTPTWPFLGAILLAMWVGISLHRFVTRRRGLLIPVGVVVSVLAAVATSGIGWTAIIGFAITLAAFLRAVQLERYPGNDELYELSIAGMIIHFVGFFVFLHVRSLQPWTITLMVTGTLTVLIALLRLNANQVSYLKFGKSAAQTVPPNVIRQNRLYTLGLFAAALALTGFGWIYRWVEAAWLWLASQIKFPQGKPTQLPPQPNRPKLPPFKMPKAPPTHSHESNLLTRIFIVVIAVVVAALVLWGIVIAARKVFLALQTFLREPPPPSFVDEQESLREKRGWLGEDGLGLRRWLEALRRKDPKWNELPDNRARVRYVYRHMLRRAVKQGYSYKPALTPDETARDIAAWQEDSGAGTDLARLVGLYQEVRYAEREVSAGDLDRLKDRLT